MIVKLFINVCCSRSMAGERCRMLQNVWSWLEASTFLLAEICLARRSAPTNGAKSQVNRVYVNSIKCRRPNTKHLQVLSIVSTQNVRVYHERWSKSVVDQPQVKPSNLKSPPYSVQAEAAWSSQVPCQVAPLTCDKRAQKWRGFAGTEPWPCRHGSAPKSWKTCSG